MTNQPRVHVSAQSDLELVQAAADGDKRAATLLADRLYERVRALVFYVTGGDRDAEDMTQLAMIEILRSCRNFRGESAVEKWADRIAVRTAMRHVKSRSWRERFFANEDDQDRPDEARQDEILARRQMRQRLARILGKLKERHRTAVVLHLVAGYSVQEVAEMVGAPVNTVRERLRVGRKKLRRLALADPVLAEYIRSGQEARQWRT